MSCSTLQRVYPLATIVDILSGDVGIACSTLQRVYPLATKTSLNHKHKEISLAVPSNGSILWQQLCQRCNCQAQATCSTLQRVYPLATQCIVESCCKLDACSTLQRVYPLATTPTSYPFAFKLSCSTLQRVYPLATHSFGLTCRLVVFLQYPPTGLSSGNNT